MLTPETLNELEKYKIIMNVHEVAEYLRISEAKVYRLANQGGSPSCVLVKHGALEKIYWINGYVKTLKQVWKIFVKMLESSFNWISFLELC